MSSRYYPSIYAATPREETEIKLVSKTTVFWDVTPCNSAEVHGIFGGTYCLYLQDRRIWRQ
jgi:hypothetical protein